MRISVAWLKDWLASVPEPKELAARLTMAGLEVEGVEAAAPPLPGIVVGEILEREKHPNADTLSVCKVNTGTEIVQIVCGAPNARAGMKAPLATIGARLPGGLEIKKAKLRGVESFGMLCSARELGLAEDATGLLELPAELRTGADLVEALHLDDTLLEINLTPNRGDCMSVRGVAREVAAITGTPLVEPKVEPVPAAGADGLAGGTDARRGLPAFCVARHSRPHASARSRRAGCRSACVARACDRSVRPSTSPTT